MSFKCDQCDEAQPNQSKPNRVVVETRHKEYHLRNGSVTTGSEIVKEVDLCLRCSD